MAKKIKKKMFVKALKKVKLPKKQKSILKGMVRESKRIQEEKHTYRILRDECQDAAEMLHQFQATGYNNLSDAEKNEMLNTFVIIADNMVEMLDLMKAIKKSK